MEFNELFPGVLLAYVNGTDCTLTNEDCNYITKFVSSLELDKASLRRQLAERDAKIAILEESLSRTMFDLQKAVTPPVVHIVNPVKPWTPGEKCERCNGSGRDGERQCPDCDGYGHDGRYENVR